RTMLAAPVAARTRGDFRGDRPEGRPSARAGSARAPPSDSPSSPRAGPSPPSCTRRDRGGAGGRQAWAEDGSQRMRKSQIEKPRDRIALSRFCYRRQKTLAPQRSEEHTSELQSPDHLVCRPLLEQKNRTALYRS